MVQKKDKKSCTNARGETGAAWFPYYLTSSPKMLMHVQDDNSVEAMVFNCGEAATATVAVQGHNTQEGQSGSTSEPYPSASINSGERRGRTYQVKDCQHLGRTFIDALMQADNTMETAYDSKCESGSKANFETEPSRARSERSTGAGSTKENLKHQCAVRGEDTRSWSFVIPKMQPVSAQFHADRPWQAGAPPERNLLQPRGAARASRSGKLHAVACSIIYFSSSTTLERSKGRGAQAHQDGSAGAHDASCEAREGMPAGRQQFRPTLRSRKGDEILRECPSKP